MTPEDKIKKLLDLAGSPNENEAKLALNKARELMAKYCITITEEIKEPQKVISEVYIPPIRVTSYNFKYCTTIINILSKHFGVFIVIFDDIETRVYGFERSIKLAKYGFDSILNQLNIAFKIGYAKERSLTYSEAFWYGAMKGIARKFTLKKEDQSSAMQVYDPIYAELQKMKLGSYRPEFNPASISGQIQGEQAGSEASFYQGLNQRTERGNLLH